MQAAGGPARLLAVFCANVIHIAPWRVAEGLFAGAARVLQSGGLLLLYGPFKREGKHTAVSNAVFDTSLRELVEMPANNLILVFARKNHSPRWFSAGVRRQAPRVDRSCPNKLKRDGDSAGAIAC